MAISKRLSLAAIGPGILVAATGVGAGDLATATFSGATLGTAILWAVLVGAGLKYVLNEGLTRWQLATGTTLLEGTAHNLGKTVQLVFLAYLILWSFLVAMALMSACGVAAHAIFPIFEDPSRGKVVFGILQSFVAVGLVLLGGYGLFEKIMSVCIGVMFVVCCGTAIILLPPLPDVLLGIFLPSIPQFSEGGLAWTIALLGGVGGTVTVLCYGYWIREEGRDSPEDLSTCRIDLGVGYTMTAFFGLAMVVIGSQLGELEGSGVTLILQVAEVLESKVGTMGYVAKWAFLMGAWGAVFSSLLGVWQSVPYLFVDSWSLLLGRKEVEIQTQDPEHDNIHKHKKAQVTKSLSYKAHLVAIATIPIVGLLFVNFKSAMQINGVVGALFIPMLSLALIILNGRPSLVGRFRNSTTTTVLLFVTLVFFLYVGGLQVSKLFS